MRAGSRYQNRLRKDMQWQVCIQQRASYDAAAGGGVRSVVVWAARNKAIMQTCYGTDPRTVNSSMSSTLIAKMARK